MNEQDHPKVDNQQVRLLKDLLEANGRWETYQRRPMTVAVLTTTYNGCLYEDFGYAKVKWPDRWNWRRGIEIAKGKALDNLARRLLNDKSLPKLYVSNSIDEEPVDFTNWADVPNIASVESAS